MHDQVAQQYGDDRRDVGEQRQLRDRHRAQEREIREERDRTAEDREIDERNRRCRRKVHGLRALGHQREAAEYDRPHDLARSDGGNRWDVMHALGEHRR